MAQGRTDYNLSEVSQLIARDLKIHEPTVHRILTAFSRQIHNLLNDGSTVAISRLGRFTRTLYKAHQGRNPKTGEKVRVPPRMTGTFKPFDDLRWIVGEGNGKPTNVVQHPSYPLDQANALPPVKDLNEIAQIFANVESGSTSGGGSSADGPATDSEVEAATGIPVSQAGGDDETEEPNLLDSDNILSGGPINQQPPGEQASLATGAQASLSAGAPGSGAEPGGGSSLTLPTQHPQPATPAPPPVWQSVTYDIPPGYAPPPGWGFEYGNALERRQQLVNQGWFPKQFYPRPGITEYPLAIGASYRNAFERTKVTINPTTKIAVVTNEEWLQPFPTPLPPYNKPIQK